ncbi:MAG: UDP-glucose 4-epimerase GalE [Rhodospirillaceae bacterium]|nr:UDP-glucose 4-epimerase GalE [Rhodospirillaceae bacterium]
MATILVTGGAGYVGSHACKALARAGHVPVTYDSLIRGHRELVKWGPLEIGDIHDKARLIEVMETHRPAAVMHFASFIFVNESVAQPDLYERNIVGGTEMLVDAMAVRDIRTLVVSSSAAVYGIPSFSPITEDAPCRPVNPYGAAKLKMEQALARAQRDHGLSWVALRYFNAAGADPEGETGEWHEPENHLIPLVLDAALGKSEAITINGDDYPTRDGTCVRDYIHVMDLAEAHLLAWRYAIGNDGGAAFNLGTGHGASVLDVVTTARKVTGHNIPVRAGQRRDGDPPALVADAGAAQRILDWAPRRSDLASQIADAWAWHLTLRK